MKNIYPNRQTEEIQTEEFIVLKGEFGIYENEKDEFNLYENQNEIDDSYYQLFDIEFGFY